MQLNVRKYGNRGPHLVILHGLLGSSQNWHSVASDLGQEFQILVPDQRNHGDSPHAEHSIELLSQDILTLLKRESLEKAVVIGHSMGGLAAMLFAFSHPECLAGLIIVDIAPAAQMDRMNWIFEALEAVDLKQVKRRQDAEEQLSEKIGNPLIRQFLLQNLKRQEDDSYDWRCNLDELHHFINREDAFPLQPDSRYEGPSLFIGGALSEHRIADRQDLIRRHFPNHQLEMLPNAGHWVHFEAMDEFKTLVSSFLHRVAPDGQ